MIRSDSLLAFCLGLSLVAAASAQQAAAPPDRDTVYRLQPAQDGTERIAVPPAEVKRGLAYNYYNENLGRRAWGFANGDGTFKYAFGEGTVMPTTRFDLRLSPEAQEELLERGSPGLQESLETTGSHPAVRLNAEGRWEVLAFRSIARVYDLETLHRWEWHGRSRKAVLHTYGDQWLLVDGRYIPATGPVFIQPTCGPLPRAGSAILVVRTPE